MIWYEPVIWWRTNTVLSTRLWSINTDPRAAPSSQRVRPAPVVAGWTLRIEYSALSKLAREIFSSSRAENCRVFFVLVCYLCMLGLCPLYRRFLALIADWRRSPSPRDPRRAGQAETDAEYDFREMGRRAAPPPPFDRPGHSEDHQDAYFVRVPILVEQTDSNKTKFRNLGREVVHLRC